MVFAGFIKNSFIDFPGLIASVVFTSGCNLNCWYCHNRDIIEGRGEQISEDEVISFLEARRGLIDAVVVSGGEPTLQPDLGAFLARLKALSFKVKLDTNGLKPEVLRCLINDGLVDYIAMDIKAPLDKYDSFLARGGDIALIEESIRLIMSAAPNYEFRTTFSPDLSVDDIVAIAKTIAGAKAYYVQQYVFKTLSTKVVGFKAFSHPPEVVKAAADAAAVFVPNTKTRGV